MAKRTVSDSENQALEKAAAYLPGGSNGNTVTMDTVIRGGRGPRVWDLSGNEYIDYALGSGPMLIGHANPEVVAAVSEQLSQGTTYFGLNEHAILLAEEIVQAVPCAEKVRFASSGTEATFFALRAVRAYRGRDKILKFEGGFHGMNDYGLMSMAPSKPSDFPTPTPDSSGIPKSLQGDVLVAPFNDIETTSAIIERYHEELAGVIVEPLQRVIPPAPGFLEGLRDVTRRFHVPLIFDEIVTGFRFAYGGAQEFYGVTPDMCTLGKAVAGGFPLSVVAGSADIMENFAPSDPGAPFVMQEGTFNGNPIGSVAGLATLKVLRREGTYERLFATGNRLKEALTRLLYEAEMPAQVVGEAPMFDVIFTDHKITNYRSLLDRDQPKVMRFTDLLRERGIFKNHGKYYVSTTHGDAEVEQTISAWKSALEALDV
ncbi:MAG: aspartate aminotransferase family protein [SAR202 cluster bacterium]|nr:aspartate aminotransferase family protein [SAR202 cluster bacterium]